MVAGVNPRVVVVVGPTASGKTAHGVALAHELRGDVVNADAMQCYRGMDVGTAKPTAAERGGVAHHLLDVWDPRVDADVADYQRRARVVVERLLAAGRSAVVVGGSGLYVRALVDDLAFPGTDPVLRARLEGELAASGAPALHARLTRLDPAAAAAIDRGDGRRLVRALEVNELTGGPYPASMPPYAMPRWGAELVGVDPGVAAVDARVGARVTLMRERGLTEEVRALAARGLGRTAARALGYAQLLAHLAGEGSEDDAYAATVVATRRYVRRQRSWARRDPRVRWLSG